MKTDQCPHCFEEERALQVFEKELTILVNRLSLENMANIPDYIIASHLKENFIMLCRTANQTTDWHGGEMAKKPRFQSQAIPMMIALDEDPNRPAKPYDNLDKKIANPISAAKDTSILKDKYIPNDPCLEDKNQEDNRPMAAHVQFKPFGQAHTLSDDTSDTQ